MHSPLLPRVASLARTLSLASAWIAALCQVGAQPSISAIPDQALSYATPSLSLSFQVWDAVTPADQLRLGISSSNSTLVPKSNLILSGAGTNRYLTVVPVGQSTGYAAVTILATNNANAVGSRTFSLQLTNSTPVFLSGIPEQPVPPNQSSTPFQFTVADLESPDTDLTVFARSLNQAVLSDSNIWINGTGATRTLWFTPATNTLGSALVQLIVTDTMGASATNLFKARIAPFRDIGLNLAGYGYEPGAGWGDYDGDGYLDFVVGGNDGNGSISCVTKLYRNLGGTNFTLAPVSLPGIQQGNLAWGECNNDGRLDLILAGPPFGGATVMRNNGDNTFTSLFSSEFLYQASCDWADYDNDGRMDFAAGGWNSSVMFSRLFRNTGTSFTTQPLTLPGTMYGRLTWADYNRDGSQDLLLVGYRQFAWYSCALYTNNTLGQLTDSGHPFPGGWYAAEWGDYDNDGWLDLLYSRHDVWGSNQLTVIYRNQGNGTLVDTGVRLPGITGGWLGWGDFDNDGRLDILMSGTSSSAGTNLTRVYRNNGNNIFTDAEAGLPAISDGRAVWGDYDNDGRLDILVTGIADGVGGITRVYHNEMPQPNSQPLPPAALSTTVSSNTVRLNWSVAADPNQASASLTYNVRVGSTLGGQDILSPMASGSGKRRLPHRGNADINTSWPLRNLSPGTYYWTVQAVDHAFEGSPFAAEQSFTITQPPSISSIGYQSFHYNTNSGPLPFLVLDAETPAPNLLVSATSSDTNIFPLQNIVFDGTGSNRTVTVSPASNALGSATITLWVTDAEGYVTNTSFSVNSYNSIPTLTTFTNLLIPVGGSSAEVPFTVGDFETPASELVLSATSSDTNLVPPGNVVFGGSGSNRTVTVTLNSAFRGSASVGVTVTDGIGAGVTRNFLVTAREVAVLTNDLPSLFYSAAAWGDYDNDGRLDLLLAGDAQTNVITRIYRNLGNGAFAEVDPGLIGVRDATVAWVDFNNDGRLDIFLAGSTNLSVPGAVAVIYRQNSNSTFTTFSDIQAGLPGYNYPAAAWGDYDGDGRPDLVFSGSDGSQYFTRLYHNNGNETFSEVQSALPPVDFGSFCWGDYDRDGYPDLLVSGYAGQAYAGVFRNLGNGSFTNMNGNLAGVLRGNANWGDYDNDGWLDIALCGWTGSAQLSRVYHNNGNHTFTQTANLPGVQDGGNAWLDFDNDGRSELLIWGYNGSVPTNTLYRNNGGGSFTDIGAVLPGVYYGDVVAGDVDGDGRLDLLATGYDGNRSTRLLRNITPQTNSAPPAPLLLTANVTSNGVTLSWTGQADTQTPLPGLGYNVRVGTSPGAGDVVGPAAAIDGFRRVVQWGNAGPTNFVEVKDLPWSGTYYWSVQSVDPAYAGSPFAAEQSFTGTFLPGARTLPPTAVSNSLATLHGLVSAKGYTTTVWFEYGSNTLFSGRADVGSAPAHALLQPFSASLTGFTPDISNYFRIVASNEVGITYGDAVAFLSGIPPTLFPGSASNIRASGATVNVSVSPNRSTTDAWFEYGTTTNYGSFTSTNTYPAAGSTYLFSRTLSGLLPGTTYHFRAGATNEFGASIGEDTVFTTTAEPLIISAGATAITNISAVLNAQINPNGFETTAWFEYGLSTNYGNYTPFVNLGTGKIPVNFSAAITNLQPGSSNFFRIIAVNAFGSTNLARSFITSNAFYRLSANALPATYLANGAAAWVDFNNDGALDIALSGSFNPGANPLFKLFRNSRSQGPPTGDFFEQTTSIIGTRNGSMSWGDYNNDGLADVLVTGFTNTANISLITRLYRNIGQAGFTNIPVPFPALAWSATAWGDFNNDGRPDLFLTGVTNGTSSAAASRIYLNNGDDTFTLLTNAIPGFGYAAAALADYNNDGWLDIAVAGLTNTSAYNPTTRLYRNNGNNTFSVVATNLTGVRDGSLAWGDYDQDGRPDLLVVGNTNYTSTPYYNYNVARVFRNNPDGSFTEVANLTGVSRGSAAWGDYDNDGRLDILMQGDRSYSGFTAFFSAVYRNTGGAFEAITNWLPAAYAGNVAWGDYDKDGRLDFLFTGITNQSQAGICAVFRNTLPVTNTPAAPPTALESLVQGPRATLRWQPGTDDRTAPAGLSYNLRIGTVPGGQDVLAPGSSLTNGFRRQPQLGNASQTRSWTFTNSLGSGTLHWSVQSVDNALAGSAFAPEQVLVFPGAPTITLSNLVGFASNSVTLTGRVDANRYDTAVWAEWGTTTNYGNTSAPLSFSSNAVYAVATALLTNLEPITTYHCRLVASNSVGLAVTTNLAFLMPGSPLLSLQTVTNIGAGQASLQVSVNPRAASTTLRFEWGLTPAFGNLLPLNYPGSGTNNVVITNLLTGLEPSTTYYFRAVASNQLGSEFGPENSFQTVPAPSLTGVAVDTNGLVSLQAAGTSGLLYTLQGSTNLVDWVTLGAMRVTNGVVEFTDPAATNLTQRFYRLLSP